MTATAPRTRQQLADRVTGYIDAGDLRHALEAGQDLNRHYPDYAHGWYLASWLLRKTQRLPDALRAIDRALALEPSDRFRLHRARCLLEAGDMAGAAAVAGELRGRPLADAVLHGELGTLLYRVGDHAGALEHYSAAIDLDQRSAEYRFNRAAVRRYLGDAAGAEQDFDAAIALRPDEFEAYNGRAQLRRQTAASNHVAQLRETIGRTRSPAGDEVAGREHCSDRTVLLRRRVDELEHDLRRREGHAVELEVTGLLDLSAGDRDVRDDGLSDVGLPDTHDAGPVLRNVRRVDEAGVDRERAGRRRQVAAVATPVDEGSVDRHLAVQVIDVVVRLQALRDDHALARAGRRAAHAVDVRCIGVRAADHAQEQPVTRLARHLAGLGEIMQAEEHALAGAATHVGGGNPDLRCECHMAADDSRKSFAKRCSTPPAS